VLFDKIASAYILFEKYICFFTVGNGQSRELALCQLYRHTFVPYNTYRFFLASSVFAARRYAAAVFAVVVFRLSVRPSVCTSQAGTCIKTTGRIELILARELPSTYPTRSYKKVRVPPKIRVLYCGTLPQTLDLENFPMATRSRCQQN